MEHIELGKTGLRSSRLVYGCMRIADQGRDAAFRAIRAALDAGYTHFDHADIYAGGVAEEFFGAFLAENPGLRDELVITTKCGIRFAGDPGPESPKRYDFSAGHIRASIDGSLTRLGVDCIDVLLLHRPDWLMAADEVAHVLEEAVAEGRVRHLGVSNFTTSQVDLLQSRLQVPLCVNQIEFNLRKPAALSDGVLDQCQRLGMSPQAWSPLAGIVHAGWGEPLSDATVERIAAEVARQSGKYAADAGQIALAWVLQHPASILPVIGSTSPDRIASATGAAEIAYEREDWYRLLEARVGEPVP